MKQVKSKITKWLLILSWIFSLILIITPNIIRTSIYIIAMVALFAAAIVDYEKKKENYRSTYVSFEEVLAVLFIQAVMVWHFYVQWISSSEITMIAKIAHVSNKTLVVSVAICSAIVSSVFILSALRVFVFVDTSTWRNMKIVEKTKVYETEKISVLICMISAVMAITICSKSSFLYPLNDWLDANCFFTVGKSMMNGVVVYRDLFEQKGPLLYFIHGIAWLFSRDTFIGVYFIEIIASFFFLYFSYKTLRLYSEDGIAIVIPILAWLVYASIPFCHGDSAEELCLPLLSYAIWVSLKALKEKRPLSGMECFTIGIMSGCVFWIKFTLVGFYLGWFIVPAFVMAKDSFQRILRNIFAIAGGVICSALPIVVYFGMNYAIGDLIEVYFYDNIFIYSAKSPIFSRLYSGLNVVLRDYRVVFVLSAFGCFWLLNRKKRKEALHCIIMLMATLLFVYMGGRYYVYYSLVLSPFAVLGFLCIYEALVRLLPGIKDYFCIKYAAVIVVAMCLLYMNTPNRYLIGVEKKELPQYQFDAIISQEKEPTLLNYGFLDGGFYTVSNIIPNCKAFCNLNTPIDEIMKLQDEYAKNGLCDFIVSRDDELNFPLYTCVAESKYYFEGEQHHYYLYKKND